MQLPVNLFKPKTGVKAATILLIVTLLIITFASMSMGAPGVTYGDVNNDGDIDVRDVVLVMQYIIGLRDLTEDQLKAADVNGDGTVDVLDVTKIMRHVLGIEELAKPVESVERAEISVPYGTPKDNIDFPETVIAILQDETEVEVDVEWEVASDPTYNAQSYNDYTFKGDLVDLPAGVSNPDQIQAKAVVTVEELHIPARRPPTEPKPTNYVLTMEGRINGSPADSVYEVLKGAGSYLEEEEVPISATPGAGYVFSHWSMEVYAGYFVFNGNKVEATQEFVYREEPSLIYIMPGQNVTIYGNFKPE